MTANLNKQQAHFSGSPAHIPPAIASERVLVPEGILQGDEIVLLAIKPGLWFIVLVSWPWLITSVGVGILAWYLGYQRVGIEWTRIGLQAAIAVALIRVSIAMFQWASRLYVLTNRRVIRLKGVLRVDVFESLLNQVQSTCLTLGPAERLLRIGTIQINTLTSLSARWEYIAQPATIHTRLRNAIARSHMNGCGEP